MLIVQFPAFEFGDQGPLVADPQTNLVNAYSYLYQSSSENEKVLNQHFCFFFENLFLHIGNDFYIFSAFVNVEIYL